MFKLFRKSVALALLIGVPIILTNNVLSYLQSIELEKEWLILIGIVVVLLAIDYRIAVKPIMEKFRQSGSLRTYKKTI